MIETVDDLLARIEAARFATVHGANPMAACSVHEDRTPSVSIGEGDGKLLLHCHSCRAGYEQLLEGYGIDPAEMPGSGARGVTLEAYARHIGLESALLVERFGLTEGRYRKMPCVRIPYRDEDGQPAGERLRVGLRSGQRFSERQRTATQDGKRVKVPLPLYGVHLLPALERSEVILVEGESDVQVGQALGLPVLGVPGALRWRDDWAPLFADFLRVVVWREPGDAGAALAHRVARTLGDRMLVIDAPPEIKDLRELLSVAGDPATARARWQDGIRATARPWAQLEAERLEALRATAPSLAEVLREVRAFLQRYVSWGSSEFVIVSLYVAHSWVLTAADCTPYLLVESAEKRSGKTRLLEALGLLCRAAILAPSVTPAGVYQLIEHRRPTLLIDETDAIFAGRDEWAQELRGVLNAGNRRGAVVIRGSREGEPQEYSVFCCKVLSGIATGKLPETIRDRAIALELKRKRRDERVSRFRFRRAASEAAPIAEALEAWARAWTETLLDAEPELPDELTDRQQDSWEPLLALADHAGGDWPKLARAAARKLAGESADEAANTGTAHQILLAVRKHWPGDRTAWWTSELLAAVNADAEQFTFGAWNDGAGMKPIELARYLRRYGVTPRDVKLTPLSGDPITRKGYRLEHFTDAWERYLGAESAAASDASDESDGDKSAEDSRRGPVPAVLPATPLPSSDLQGKSKIATRYRKAEVASDEIDEIPGNGHEGSGVAGKTAQTDAAQLNNVPAADRERGRAVEMLLRVGGLEMHPNGGDRPLAGSGLDAAAEVVLQTFPGSGPLQDDWDCPEPT